MTGILVFITAISFYFIGRWSTSQELEQRIDRVVKIKPKSDIIKRPSKTDLDKKKNKYQETEEVMEEIIDETLHQSLPDNG